MKAGRVWIWAVKEIMPEFWPLPQHVCLKLMDDPPLPLKVKNPEEEEEEEAGHSL